MTDLTRLGTAAQKKVVRSSAVNINDEVLKAGGFSLADVEAGKVVGTLFIIPAHSIVTRCFVVMHTPAIATTATIKYLQCTQPPGKDWISFIGDFDLTKADGEDIDAAPFSGKFATSAIEMEAYFSLSGTGIKTIGDFDVVLDYIEYRKTNGEYTPFMKAVN